MHFIKNWELDLTCSPASPLPTQVPQILACKCLIKLVGKKKKKRKKMQNTTCNLTLCARMGQEVLQREGKWWQNTHRTKAATTRLHYLHCTRTNSFILSKNSAISGTNFTITLSWLAQARPATAKSVPALSPNPDHSVRAFLPSALLLTKSKTISSETWQPHKPHALLCQS